MRMLQQNTRAPSPSILSDSSVDLSGVHTPALGEVQSSQSGELSSPGQASPTPSALTLVNTVYLLILLISKCN